ncbi:hypothetical protein FQ775_23885 [Nitratireductor mangrovi]|uniref:Uncharacterized protein n=1 Tax=Nitratireductor mangrovi TaxID=2599600 RepID=A0A6H0DX64_9HYPH|nr:hypothetical protein [Nitratireductor mangrovi]QIS94646.1 hypothetical protein FQ775_23885 [Nitratireductor mangrovi]
MEMHEEFAAANLEETQRLIKIAALLRGNDRGNRIVLRTSPYSSRQVKVQRRAEMNRQLGMSERNSTGCPVEEDGIGKPLAKAG